MVCLPFHPSFCPSICPGVCLEFVSLVFSKFWYNARNPYEVVCDRAGFSRKNFFAPKIGKMDQKWVKNGFFEYVEKFCHWFLLNLFCNENSYLLCSCLNPIFGKILVPEIWAKMFLANQIAGFFNQPYLQNKSVK